MLLHYQPLCHVYRVGGVDAEEDVQDLRHLFPRLDPTHRVMLLLGSERALHRRGPHPRQLLTYIVLLLLPMGGSPALYKRGLDAVLLAEVAVVRAGVARVAAYLLYVHAEQAPVHLDAVPQPRSLVEGVERQLLDKRDPVHHDVVALRAELHSLHLLAPDDGSHVRLRHAHYPVGDALPAVAAVEWLCCWRYTFVSMSTNDFSLTVKSSLPLCSRSILRISFSSFLSRFSRRRVIFLVRALLCLRCLQYDRLAFSTSRNFVLGRRTYMRSLNSHMILYDLSTHSQSSFWSVGYRISLS